MKAKHLIAALKSLPCEDCGRVFAAPAMDFDHDPATKKLFSLSHCKGKTFLEVALELEKCEVVCANCHRLRTASRPSRPGRPGPKIERPGLVSKIIEAMSEEGRPMTARELQSRFGFKDDRRVRYALLTYFSVVSGTGVKGDPLRFAIRP
jgi:hypothetical protein